MTDKLSKVIEQIVDKAMRNFDMTSTQAPVSKNNLDSTIDSLSQMSPRTGNLVVKNNSVWMWLEDPADQMMVAVMLVLSRNECSFIYADLGVYVSYFRRKPLLHVPEYSGM
jgi:meiotically up-regulated gene 157 (Mug157) protein